MSKLDFQSNDALDALQEQLHTATLCDILDELGFRNQAMRGSLRPLDDGYRLLGRARTMLCYDVADMPDRPYATEIEAVDTIRPGDVVVVGTNHFGETGHFSNGFWGELMATAAIGHGGRGVFLDGAVRDITQLRALGKRFKVFAAGRNPLDSKGRCLVASYDRPVICDGVTVHPGDYVFGDVDGVVVIPQAQLEKVVELALTKSNRENSMREDLLGGVPLGSAFEKHRIL